MKLLLVEDSERLRRSVGTGLRKSGYAVDVTGTGDEGLHLAKTANYDVIILDLMLPGMDGLTVLRRLREAGKTTHVLVLTARDAVEDRVRGLRTGADDYLIKPFHFDELLARVEALARRGNGVKDPHLNVGDLQIDIAARTVSRRGIAIDLAPREYALLELLAMRCGQVVSRTEIEEHIYESEAELMSNVVDSAVCALRRKIDAAGSGGAIGAEHSMIRTRRGMGYMLIDPKAERARAAAVTPSSTP